MDLGQQIVIIVSIFLVVWYLIFATINRRRGIAMYYWLREGLQVLGDIDESSWIGSSGSGARLVVGKAQKPFKRVEMVYLLESREILPLWIFNRIRGKRDEIILKATLRSAPVLEVEVARAGDRQMEDMIAKEKQKPYTTTASQDNFAIAQRGRPDEVELKRLEAFLNQYQANLFRISLQRSSPHLILRSYLPDPKTESAEDFFNSLRTWLAGGRDQD